MRRINRLAELLAAGLLAVATLSVSLQVSVRFVLDNFSFIISAPWTEEVCRYAMIWAIFLGVSVLCRDGRLIAVDVLLHKLPVLAALVMEVAAMAVTIIFLLWFGYLGIKMTGNGLHETSPVLQIPMAVVYVAVPVGCVLSISNIIAFLADRLRAPGARQTVIHED